MKPSRDGINRVAYRAFSRRDQARLERYLAYLQQVVPAELNRREQFAFWINLYNAKTVDIVLRHYPVGSIKDINLGGGLLGLVSGGPWKAKVATVAGHRLSLDDIEHSILRPIFRDPRLHYAINCASIGCPNLSQNAYTGAMLEQQLDAAARAYVNHPRGVKVSGGQVRASKIYSWFQADFGGTESGVLRHLRRYADPSLARKLAGKTAISSFAYDWNLNDASGGRIARDRSNDH